MHKIKGNRLAVVGLVVFLIVGGGCDRKTTGHSKGSTTVAGRKIAFSVDGPATIERSDAATLTFGSHKLRIEKERFLLDDNEVGRMSVPASRVEVVVSNATLTITADRINKLTIPIAR